ncbi:MAG: alpha-1,4-glucan--maltose-1-phosphate maltosyltransferase [Deltaproteobacteria bacterium]|nr:alpha-1,4-glucan--maltose-1-phosphate maltosyltransferase [Deltaproteobacteria bacterium]
MIPSANAVQIENVWPEIDAGRYPIKRVVGDELEVQADIFSHGHEVLLARVLYRASGAAAWQEAELEAGVSDRWIGRFRLEQIGRYDYTIIAWRDAFRSWRTDLKKRVDGRQHTIASELLEGQRIIAMTLERVGKGKSKALSEDRRVIRAMLDRVEDRITEQTAESRALALIDKIKVDAKKKMEGELSELQRLVSRAFDLRTDDDHGQDDQLVKELFGVRLTEAMERHSDRADGGQYPRKLQVMVERRAARFSSWYEMWPRSQGEREGKSATFADMQARLDEIQQMGFDVIYLPPIHPIGHTNRKGANNSLECPPASPGCPYAIGNSDGGHTAVDPDLGTIEDFDVFVAACHERGMEVALDYALQASPDHPWVKEHPEWFYQRPDGTIKYAENPPKKYQDVYPLNFNTEDREGLWAASLEILRFWISHGVRIFRVDNPHTKPFQFWEWLIEQVHTEDPNVFFLAEAFTRPKVMKALGKCGFSQSYTYFTWRNFKAEIEEYFGELTGTEVAETMRGNLFTNTPDILPRMLQDAPRAAFMMRAALAGTLSSVWGLYNGFELCEGRAIPNTEEYLDSEKYQHKVWDWDRPGNIKPFLTKLNRARHSQPALQRYANLRLCVTESEHILAYYKATEDLSNIIVCVVNLDPYQAHETLVHLPLDELDVRSGENYQMHDLLRDQRYIWHGLSNYVRLDPKEAVAHIFQLLRWSHREQDFDYYL